MLPSISTVQHKQLELRGKNLFPLRCHSLLLRFLLYHLWKALLWVGANKRNLQQQKKNLKYLQEYFKR